MANKQVIRLTESDLRKIIKESVNNILTEESYRKAAKQGDKTSVVNKKELKRKKRDGYKNASRDFHKFAKKHNLDKMKSGASAVCNWEDGCDDNGRYVANENLSKLDFGRIIKESVKKILKEDINLNPNQFVIVSAWDDMHIKSYSKLIKNYADAMVTAKYDGNVFIIPKKDVYSSFDDMPNIAIYQIPDSIQSLDEIEECLLNGDITLDMLEEID
jgi:hypothetical protein